MMFRYGIASSSSATVGIVHPEDLQPNEGINKRKSTAPPLVSKSVPFARRGTRGTRHGGMRRGGHLDHREVKSDVPQTQHAIRGKPWRGSGRRESSNPSRSTTNEIINEPLPGTHSSGPSTANTTLYPMGSTKATSSSAPIHTKKANLSKPIHPLPKRPHNTTTRTTAASASYHPPNENAHAPVAHSILSRPITIKMEPPNSSPLHEPPQKVVRTRTTPPYKRRKMSPPSTSKSTPIKLEDHGDLLRPPSQKELADKTSTKTQPSIPLPKRRPRPPPPELSAAPPEPIVKLEPQSLTLPLSPVERKLVKESCSFFPMPENCRKSHSDFQKNRRDFFRREYRTLLNFGLTKTRVFFRDDGMVIEWKSPVPVWSDSFLPEVADLASVIVRAHKANNVSSGDTFKRGRTESMSSSSKKLHNVFSTLGDHRSSVDRMSQALPPPSQIHPTPIALTPPIPKPESQRPKSLLQRTLRPFHTPTSAYPSNSSFNSSAPTSAPATYNPTTQVSMPTITLPDQDNESYARITRADTVHHYVYSAHDDEKETSIVAEHLLRYPSEDAQEGVEALAIEYLRRYIESFDGDRTLLDGAYSENAVFSCSVHHPVHSPSPLSITGFLAPPGTHTHSTYSNYSTAWQGRSDIVNKICLLGAYQFCPRGQQANLHYDVVSLGSLEIDGLLLKVHGEIVNPNPAGPQLDHIVTLDQSFVLKHPLPVENDRQTPFFATLGGPPWPLVAISHQMVVRDTPLLSPSKIVELLPWLSPFLS